MVGSQEIKSILVKRVLREILELLVSLLRWCLAKTIDQLCGATNYMVYSRVSWVPQKKKACGR